MTTFCPQCGEPLPTGPDGRPLSPCPLCHPAEPGPAAPQQSEPQAAPPAAPAQPGFAPPPPPPPEWRPPVPEAIAWESESPLAVRFFKTFVQVACKPRRVFAGPFQPGLAWALGFSLVTNTLVMGLQTLKTGRLAMLPIPLPLPLPLLLLLLPILVVVWEFAGSGLTHIFLRLVGSGKQGFAATFRVGAYGSALAPLMLVPFLGEMVSLVWSLVVWVAGLAAVHRTGVGKPIGAALLALLALLLLGIALTAIFAINLDWQQLGPRRSPLSL